MLILDKSVERRIRAQRKSRGIDQHDEVWEGLYVMSPLADIEHQSIVKTLVLAFYHGVERNSLGQVLPGANVSDRTAKWTKNYRTPDVVVVLKDSAAQNHEKFWTGPVDFLVEVVSRGDRSKRKLPFYSKIGVRELLVVDRRPWRLTLYRHNGQNLTPVGTCEVEHATGIQSDVLPNSFRLVPGDERPQIEITYGGDGQQWLA